MKYLPAIFITVGIAILASPFVYTGIYGINPAPTIGNPQVIVEVLDPSLDQYAAMWKKEVGRRFDNAVVILCHGGNFVKDEWIIGAAFPSTGRHVTPVGEVVERIRKQYPGRTVVLLACNTGHLVLHARGVFYAKSSVFCIPDRELSGDVVGSIDASRTLDGVFIGDGVKPRSDNDPDVVGNVYEFIEGVE